MLLEGAAVGETPFLGTISHIPYGFGRSLQVRIAALDVCWTFLLENSRRAFNNLKLLGSS